MYFFSRFLLLSLFAVTCVQSIQAKAELLDTDLTEKTSKLSFSECKSLLSSRKARAATQKPYGGSNITLKALDLSSVPTEKELCMAGQLGSALSPHGNAEPLKIRNRKRRIRQARDNLLFGRAMQLWNQHNYKEAAVLFKQHRNAFSKNSPWAGEAELHLGCEAQFNGRWGEAEACFDWILENTKVGSDIYQKAKLRKSVLLMEKGDIGESIDSFAEMLHTETAWERRTYAQNWIRQMSVQKKHLSQLRNCGNACIAEVLVMKGQKIRAKVLCSEPAHGDYGYTLAELEAAAQAEGLLAKAVRVTDKQLKGLSFPIIAYYYDEHYVTVRGRNSDGQLIVFDDRIRQPVLLNDKEFTSQWSGLAVIFDSDATGVEAPADNELQKVGGCCGLPRPEDDLGDDCDTNQKKSCRGSPVWEVNPVNMNFVVRDVPIWYEPELGPAMEIYIVYNSQDALNQLRPIGNKWSFGYASYAMEGPNGSVDIVMPHGRRDHWTLDSGNYVSPSRLNDYSLAKTGDYHYQLTLPDDSVYEYGVPTAMPGGTNMLLLSITDIHGHSLSFTHDANGRLVTITDALGRNTELVYNADGLIESITDPFGRTATFGYTLSADGVSYDLTHQTDMGGIAYGYRYDEVEAPFSPGGFMSHIDLSRGTYAITIEPADGLRNGSDPYPELGETMWENYRIRITDPEDGLEEFYFDGYHSEGWYRDAKQMLSNEAPLNAPKTKYDYTTVGSESRGEISRISYADGSYVNYSNLTDAGQPRTIRDSRGKYHYYTYNDKGKTLSYTDPDGNTTNFEYGTSGRNLIRVINPNNVIERTFTYNAAQQITSFTDALGNTTQLFYRADGLIDYVINPLNETTDYVYYSGEPRLERITHTAGNGTVAILSSYTYDSMNGVKMPRIKTITDSRGYMTLFEYDDLDRITREHYPDGMFTEYGWGCCNLDYIRDPQGGITRFYYDGNKRLKAQQDPLGQLTRYLYEPNGNLRRLIDANGNPTTWTYDALNRVSKKTDATGNFTAYQYDTNGNRTGYQNARGQTVNYHYDSRNNLDWIDLDGDGVKNLASGDADFTYDALNRLQYMDDRHGRTIWTYDVANQIDTVDGPWVNDLIDYEYDSVGRVIGRSIDGSASLTEYDSLSRVESQTNALGRFDFTYVGDSQDLSTVDYPNGQRSKYSYHSALSGNLRLSRIEHLDKNLSNLSTYDYTYDAKGQITQWTRQRSSTPSKAYNLTYDSAGQLLDAVDTLASDGSLVVGHHYRYDPAGNRIQARTDYSPVTATHNTLNQLTGLESGGVIDFRGTVEGPAQITVNDQPARMYDDGDINNNPGGPMNFEAELELTPGTHTIDIIADDSIHPTVTQSYSITVADNGISQTLTYDVDGNLLNDGIRSYEWDELNRLIKITEASHETLFEYDGMNRRVRIVESESGTKQSNHIYLWEGSQIVQRRDSTGASVERSYFNNGFREGINDYYYTHDHLGSIREVMASNGTTIESVYSYSPWGEITKISGNGVESDFLYTGHFYHNSSNLHLTRYRAYDPELGRWLSRDPLEFNLGFPAEFLPEGSNLYAYVGNNPANYTDKDGQFAWFGATIGAGISFGTQFAANGGLGAIMDGDWSKVWQSTKCVDYADVAISAGMGALGLSAGKNAFQAAKGIRAAHQARKGRHLTNYLKEEAIESAKNEATKGAAKGIGALAGKELKEHVDVVPGGDDCE